MRADFKWPSLLYAVDIVAWDVFFGLAVLFAVPAFARDSAPRVRAGLIATGSLCLIGLVGPFANALGWRAIGIFGYTIVFALTCLPLSREFSSKAQASRRLDRTP
jgi:peptidoglycan/LPS O-acetylase OafA/YrhL